jgi:adenylyltransferase/sulfurtransferase
VVIGCIPAVKAITYIVGLGGLLTKRVLIYDGLSLMFTELKVRKDPNCEQGCQLGGKE